MPIKKPAFNYNNEAIWYHPSNKVNSRNGSGLSQYITSSHANCSINKVSGMQHTSATLSICLSEGNFSKPQTQKYLVTGEDVIVSPSVSSLVNCTVHFRHNHTISIRQLYLTISLETLC